MKPDLYQQSNQICVRCIMDTTNPETTFDRDGVCNFCHAYETASPASLPEHQTQIKLNEVVERIRTKGAGRDYDCILGLSGGVDSSFLAWKLSSLGLRTLAVQFDNGWNSEKAVRNIELLCTKLKMDLFTYVVDWEEFRDLELSFMKAGLANIEAPTDHGIFATLYKVAAEKGIKCIINGNNIVTEQISVSGYGYNYQDIRHIRAVHRRFGERALRTFPQMSLFKKLFYERVMGIQSISLLNFIEYNKKQAKAFLENEIGWKDYGGKHNESVITQFHQTIWLPEKFHMDKRRAHLSNLIFSGQISREEALVEIQKPVSSPPEMAALREYVLKKFGLSLSDFNDIMRAPQVDYHDYPNDEWLYRLYISFATTLRNFHRKQMDG